MANNFLSADIGRFAVHLTVATLCGAAVGIERQWRGRHVDVSRLAVSAEEAR